MRFREQLGQSAGHKSGEAFLGFPVHVTKIVVVGVRLARGFAGRN